MQMRRHRLALAINNVFISINFLFASWKAPHLENTHEHLGKGLLCMSLFFLYIAYDMYKDMWRYKDTVSWLGNGLICFMFSLASNDKRWFILFAIEEILAYGIVLFYYDYYIKKRSEKLIKKRSHKK